MVRWAQSEAGVRMWTVGRVGFGAEGDRPGRTCSGFTCVMGTYGRCWDTQRSACHGTIPAGTLSWSTPGGRSEHRPAAERSRQRVAELQALFPWFFTGGGGSSATPVSHRNGQGRFAVSLDGTFNSQDITCPATHGAPQNNE